jgi:shikimate kinase
VVSRADQIVLIGLPGAGKSTVGPLLARRVGWKFIDLDHEIESETGLRVRDIFEQRGEAEFRRLETDLTQRLASEPNLVISAGGGWMMHNRLPNAKVVWLCVTPEEAVNRLGDSVRSRPLLQSDPMKRMQQLLNEREKYYENADVHIDTDGMPPHSVAVAVAVAVGNS